MKKGICAKLLVCILAVVMTIGMLAGCNKTQEASTTGSDSGSSSSGDSSGEKITLIMSLRDEFLSTLEEGAIAAAKEYGVNLTTVDAQNDTSKMLQFIETARNDGQKAVIINSVDSDATADYIKAAGDMKVVIVNRYPTDDSVLNENVVYVGSDEKQAGTLQAEFLSEYFSEKGQTDISYILLQGIIGHVSTTNRSESVIDGLAANGLKASEATAPLAAEYSLATAQDMIAPLLNTIEYDCIISNSDAMALGAIEAMKAEKLDPSSIPIVGVDATVDGCQAIKDGSMAMSVYQNGAGQGSASVAAAINMIEGNAVNDGTDYELDDTGYVIWVPFEPVTADNVDDYINK
ncbi:MAG: substrate-binding domain-containing protein [Lachnospiraceae bacterium]